MRNGQQKQRMRSRNNNRRSSNPLTRVYESNGPDVKVRGTAHHIAEKYQQLARDAQSSGDPVAAENYLQHAEHYLRLIASFQGQFAPQAGYGRDDEMDDDEMDDVGALDAPQPYSRPEPSYQPREREQREPREAREPRAQREGRQSYRRNRDEDGQDSRQEGRQEGRQDNRQDGRQESRQDSRQDSQPREPREGYAPREGYQPREYRGRSRERDRDREEGVEGGYAPRTRQPRSEEAEAPARPVRVVRGDEEQPDIGLPAFITAGPVKEAVREAPEPEVAEAADADARPGRRRRTRFRRADRAEGAEAAGESAGEAPQQQPLFGE